MSSKIILDVVLDGGGKTPGGFEVDGAVLVARDVEASGRRTLRIMRGDEVVLNEEQLRAALDKLDEVSVIHIGSD